MSPADTLLGAIFFATIITIVVNTIISAYTDEINNEEGDDENVD